MERKKESLEKEIEYSPNSFTNIVLRHDYHE